jgi:hypothetical protein
MSGDVKSTASPSPSQIASSTTTSSTGQFGKTTGASKGPRKSARTGVAGGSTITQVPGKRLVRQFPITESEINQLDRQGLISALFSGFGAAALGFGANLYKDYFLGSGLSEIKLDALWWGSVLCIIVGVIFLLFGFIEIKSNKGLIKTIKNETTFDN